VRRARCFVTLSRSKGDTTNGVRRLLQVRDELARGIENFLVPVQALLPICCRRQQMGSSFYLQSGPGKLLAVKFTVTVYRDQRDLLVLNSLERYAEFFKQSVATFEANDSYVRLVMWRWVSRSAKRVMAVYSSRIGSLMFTRSGS
jgi:hypothetical protein